ncbi:alpha/beta fold hydrolase [Pseudoflavitalea rhizosphaerae]|uniref:alpha/beta fold hydrolase n=1 Tax=Pseudoflavitalea rhizosphaerae TaxID=1884793 RepID=UPI000F8E3B4D|nr:alpha/beta fold hydrolase [Pseudoflavitalea rhizosphaerae]
MNAVQEPKVYHRTLKVKGLDIFYREAGDPSNPAVLLMHGYPNSSFLYRKLLPALAAANYYAIAPDFPGMGFSSYPSGDEFPYTFRNFANIIAAFTEKMQLKKFAIYLHDYGSLIGMHVALMHPPAIIFRADNPGYSFLRLYLFQQ